MSTPDLFQALDFNAADPELIALCIEQTRKDFQRAGVDLGDQNETWLLPEQFFYSVKAAMLFHIPKSSDVLQRLFYLVDLAQDDIKHAYRMNGNDAIASALSRAILEREMKKVLIRKAFASRQKPADDDHSLPQ
jgi:hypothetical protein